MRNLNFWWKIFILNFWSSFRGFWQKNKINVFPSIFMKFLSRNSLDQLDWLTHTGCKFPVYYLLLRASIDCNSVSSIIVCNVLFFRWVVNYISYDNVKMYSNCVSLCSLTAAKGQTISKGNRGVLNSSEKRTKNYYPEYFLKRGCSEEKIFVGFFWKES